MAVGLDHVADAALRVRQLEGTRVIMMTAYATVADAVGALKLGAVILPTSVVLGPHDLDDRVERARVRLVIAEEADAAKFDTPNSSANCGIAGATTP